MLKEKLKKKIQEISLKKFKSHEDLDRLKKHEEQLKKMVDREAEMNLNFQKKTREEQFLKQGETNKEFQEFVNLKTPNK